MEKIVLAKRLCMSALFGLILGMGATTAMSADLPLQILTAEEPPTNYADGAKVTGITVDIIEDVKKRVGVTIEIEIQPWARVIETGMVRPNVVLFTMGKTPERVAHGFNFIGPVTTRKHMIFKKNGTSLNLATVDDVKAQKLTVGGMRGDWRTNFLKDQGVRVEEVTTNEMNVRKLMADRFKLMVLSDLELGMNLLNAKVKASDIEPAFVFKEASSYFALSRGTSPEVVKAWEKAFADFQKSDTPAKLTKKWSAILGMNLAYTPDKGFFVK